MIIKMENVFALAAEEIFGGDFDRDCVILWSYTFCYTHAELSFLAWTRKKSCQTSIIGCSNQDEIWLKKCNVLDPRIPQPSNTSQIIGVDTLFANAYIWHNRLHCCYSAGTACIRWTIRIRYRIDFDSWSQHRHHLSLGLSLQCTDSFGLNK